MHLPELVISCKRQTEAISYTHLCGTCHNPTHTYCCVLLYCVLPPVWGCCWADSSLWRVKLIIWQMLDLLHWLFKKLWVRFSVCPHLQCSGLEGGSSFKWRLWTTSGKWRFFCKSVWKIERILPLKISLDFNGNLQLQSKLCADNSGEIYVWLLGK